MACSLAALESLVGFALNGVVLAGIIALAAIGLTLVYGILRLSNFAHGDLLTTGAYLAFAFNAFYAPSAGIDAALWTAGILLAWVAADLLRFRRLRMGEQTLLVLLSLGLLGLAARPELGAGALGPRFVLASVLSMVWLAALLVALDVALWRPLRKQGAGVVTMIITSIGLALLLRNVLALVFGTSIESFERPVQPPMEIIGFRITQVQIGTLVVAAVVVAAVHVLLRHTRFGKTLRAVADDPELARICGIDVDRMVRYVWILAGALAALAGILLALNVNLNNTLGWRLILPIFAAVILGGIGSVYGAMLGALVIAVTMEVSVAFLPDAGYRLAVGFAVLIAAMLLRPQGLLGVKR